MGIKNLLKMPLISALEQPAFRYPVIFELKNRHFSSLDIGIPLTHGMHCPITAADSFFSFSEIFVTDEYGGFLNDIPLPRRWLDLGCHTAYFSLYLAWQHARAGTADSWAALLVDADSRVIPAVEKAMAGNGLQDRYHFLHGAITAGEAPVRFALRSGMGSSTDDKGESASGFEEIPAATPALIAKLCPPPYDLVKIDVEGAEFAFLEHYESIYSQAKVIIAEWHSWDKEGTKEGEFRRSMEARGFVFMRELQEKRVLNISGSDLSAGTHMYRRAGEATPAVS